MEITSRWARDYMTEDQRFAAWRPDVLVYRGEPLVHDLTLAGPVRARLWVSTTGSAADWIVKLINVNPGEMPGGDDDEASPHDPGAEYLVPLRGSQSPDVGSQYLRSPGGGLQGRDPHGLQIREASQPS
jgi:hypothetical protein